MNPTKPAFLITIDTEGDDLWSKPQEITTHIIGFRGSSRSAKTMGSDPLG